MTGRATLGLHNSYDKLRFAEAHRRAVCRAAALAWAFDWNLATFGFPFDQADGPTGTDAELAAWLADSTTIGEQGRYLEDLAGAGRFATHPMPDPGFPPQLGRVVVATRDVDPDRSLAVPDLAEALASGRSHLVLFGLGPRGLPAEVPVEADAHLDVTGRGRVLETATAMGAVVGAVDWVRRSLYAGSR